MRVLAMAFASCLSVSAFGVTIPGLPQSAFADTEAWNLVKVTRRGCGFAYELVEAKGRKPGLKLEV